MSLKINFHSKLLFPNTKFFKLPNLYFIKRRKMNEYLTVIANQIGIPVWLLLIIIAWTLFWKLTGLWKSARNGKVVWFLAIALINTVGILPILYIHLFSKIEFDKPKKRFVKKKTNLPSLKKSKNQK
jgi:hypothetical protein